MSQTDIEKSHPAHRSEIDGLRAIAVLAVVFYHFGVPGVGGGFVGVDIFFVISGFLIGGILWREKMATGRLSLGRFYLRRIRRLAPAYVAMAAVVLIVGWAVLLPYDYRETAKAVIASTVYLSNVLFFRQSGYFDGAAEDKILLHSWSLSVEEQFYLFLPLVFLVFARSRRAMIVALVTLFLVSLAASLPMTFRAQSAAFYLFPFRAWELLAGVLLAIWGAERATDWRVSAPVSWLGLGLVLGAVFLVQPGYGFPGWQALVPVTGTVLLILNGRDANIVNRALSLRIPVGIGLISYSLYLWHWPVLTMSKYIRVSYAGPGEVALWICISIVLAALSWRFIEQPVRRASGLSGRTIFGSAVVASLALILASTWIFWADGLVKRFGTGTQVHIAASGDFLQDFSRCHISSDGGFAGLEVCPIGPPSKDPDLLIWGDSHVRAFYEGLSDIANQTDRAALVIWRAGCPPAFGIAKQESAASLAQDLACADANNQIELALQENLQFRDILLIGRWAYYANGTGVGADTHNTITLRSKTLGPMAQDQLLGQALKITVQSLAVQDRKVFILRQPPEIPNYNAPKIARALGLHQITRDQARRLGGVTLSDAHARAATGQAAIGISGARVLDSWPWFCDPFLCEAVRSEEGLYFDNNHITNTAARHMRDVFEPVFVRDRR